MKMDNTIRKQMKFPHYFFELPNNKQRIKEDDSEECDITI